LDDSDDDDNDDVVPSTYHSTDPLKSIQVKPNDPLAKNNKLMITKQIKLIEARRMELMQQRKGSIGIGSNLNSISNQQWDSLNECNPNGKLSHLHFDLSDDTREDDSIVRVMTETRSIRKTLVLDHQQQRPGDNEDNDGLQTEDNSIADADDNDDDDDNNDKENLFPKLDKMERTTANANLYPNLNNLSNQTYKDQNYLNTQFNKMGSNHQNEMETDNNFQINNDELPFTISAAATDRLIPKIKENKHLIKAFFNDDDNNNIFGVKKENHMESDDDCSSINRMINSNNNKSVGSLFKRGLGGSTFIEEDNNSLSSFKIKTVTEEEGQEEEEKQHYKKENEYQQEQQVISNLSMADVDQRVKSRILKPKFINRFQITLKKLDNSINDLGDVVQAEADDDDVLKLKSLNLNKVNNIVTNHYIPLKESLVNNFLSCYSDACLFNARRFRVTWSPCLPTPSTYIQLKPTPNIATAVHLTSAQLITPIVANISPSIQQQQKSSQLEYQTNELMKQNCEKYLRIQLDQSEFQLQNDKKTNKFSQLKPKMSNELISQLNDCTQQICNTNSTNSVINNHSDWDNLNHMKHVWKLCQCLWGDIPDSRKIHPGAPISDYENEQIRKQLLGEWLSDVTANVIDHEFKQNKNNNYLQAIFSLLTGKRLYDASIMAVEHNDYRLAMLLAQASSSNNTIRSMAKKQLKEWLISGTDKYLDLNRIKFYVLVSGDLTINIQNQSSSSQTINICDNLDWKRQFSMHLWYHCLPIYSIKEVMNSYEESVNTKICNRPYPPYIENDSSGEFSSKSTTTPTETAKNSIKNLKKSTDFYDTCFHLIKLYCNDSHSIADTIEPLNHSANLLDYRLSWHLIMSLVALNYTHVSQLCLINLHENFALQLQSIGLWQWSIFVLMHIDDEQR
jgi:hypothetical protein